jgi:serralysin
VAIDGIFDEWTDADRLDTPGTAPAGYELYGRVIEGKFVFALRASIGTSIGAGTTFWLDTDSNPGTGFQIFGSAGGAEYNVNFFTDGVPYLYTGADGETFVSGPLTHAYSSDGRFVEFEVPFGTIGETDGKTNVLVDVNNQIFLPGDYSAGGYTLSGTQTPPPATTIGSITLDGSLNDWTAADRLDRPGAGQSGYEVYGRFEGDNYIIAIKSAVAIGANTTAWLNTDRNAATGYQIFGTSGGAEYNVNFGSNLAPSLYTGAAGATLVTQGLSHGFSSDHKVVEFAIPKGALSGAPGGIDLLLDINDQVFLPGDYAAYTYTINGPSTLPPVVDQGFKVGIVYSETSANAYFSKMAYSQLFMAAQNQAAMAGIPFDLLSETDLTNPSKLAQYDALVFPSFRNVPLDKLAVIQDALTDAVYKYGVSLITAGDFMTNDAAGAVLPGDPYARMKTLLGLTREGGATGDVAVIAGDTAHPMMQGYNPDEAIHTYTNSATSWFNGVDTSVTAVAEQVVNGQTHNAVVTTQTGGRNVHFATEGMLADNNMLGHALDWTVNPTEGPSLSLHMSRQDAVVASRNDMDQSQETSEVNPDGSQPGIYDVMLPILAQWKQAYNFVGSYYINVGANPPDQVTDWSISKPYYDQLIAMGNEIGTHSYTHPENTNDLTPAQIEFEFLQSKQAIEQQLGISVLGTAVPGAPETFDTAQLIQQYFPYMSGGASMLGAGYPGAFGYMTAGDTSSVYIAPNTSFDFTLVGFQGKTAEEATAAWAAEWATLVSHADLPVVVWPWHDYGPTQWQINPPSTSPYTLPMFTSFIQTAYQAGAEFVTLADLAHRISAIEKATLDYSYDAGQNTITANVGSDGVGKFALDVSGTQKIKSVNNWYAYDEDSVFLGKTGGSYTINLGASQDDISHISALPARAELLTISGDGTNLAFTVFGEGTVVIDLKNPSGASVQVTGASVTKLVGDHLELNLSGIGQHVVAVNLVNSAPALSNPIANQVASEDSSFTFAIPDNTFADEVGSILTYTATRVDGAALPTWLHFEPATRTFSGTPTNGDVGTLSIKVTATDPSGLSVSDDFDVAVVNTNDAPVYATAFSDQSAAEDSQLTFTLPPNAFTDEDAGDVLTYTATRADGATLPAWLHFDPATRTLSGTPANGDVGTLSIKITATDVFGASASGTFSLTVNNTNDAPVLAALLTDQAATEGKPFTFAVPPNAFTDEDAGDVLVYTATRADGSGLPTWLHFDPTTRTFSGTPANGETGTLSIKLIAVDPSGLSASDDFDLVIAPGGIARIGGSGNDSLTGTAGPDTLSGGAGNDTLDGLGGADSLVGGIGNDMFIVDNVGDQVVEAAGGGTDTVRTSLSTYTLSANVEHLVFSGQGAFTGIGNGLANSTTGGAGNDSLDGGAGSDTLIGGLGDDAYSIDNLGDRIVEDLNSGIDTIRSSISVILGANIENLVLLGTSRLNGTGNSLDNQITGNGGTNILDGGSGNDTLAGGLGNDTYVLDSTGDVVVEGTSAGTDTIRTVLTSLNLTGFGNIEDLVYTGPADFQGFGNNLANSITGGAGRDLLDGGLDSRSDVLSGGLGNDTYIVRTADIVNEAANAGRDTVKTDLLTYSLSNNIEDLVFIGTGSFRGTGNALNNMITGGTANDVLNGGAGADTMDGGAGDDSYTLDHSGDIIVDSGGSDLVTISGGLTSYTLQDGIEKLSYSGSSAFTATGNDGANAITTGTGNDVIRGGAGMDTLGGGGGTDNILGQDGNDSLTGGAGADTLEGGQGLDVLTGGTQGDMFIFGPPSGTSRDQVMDFSTSQGDKLAIRSADYGLVAGSLAADWFEVVTTAAGVGTKAHAEFIYNSATRTLSWDQDGAGSAQAVAIATFASAIALRNVDILVL